MTAHNITNIMKKLLQELIVPDIHEIKNEIRGLDGRINSLENLMMNFIKTTDTRFNVLERESVNLRDDIKIFKEEIKSLREETNNVRGALSADINNLRGALCADINNAREDIRSLKAEFRLAIDLHERIATLEARLPH